MFSIFRRRLLDSGILCGMTDVHSHILPGVDDGMPSLSESFSACLRLESLGIRRVFLTPHVMSGLPSNRPEFLRERFSEFVSENPSGVEFRLAAEYMLDPGFPSHLDEGLLSLGGSRVLVETSYMGASPEFRDYLYGLRLRGYRPVLAHPERYLYLTVDELLSLRDGSLDFQLNLPSLAGAYGPEVRRRAFFLLRSGRYDFAGSDIHSLGTYLRVLSRLRLSGGDIRRLRELLRNNESLE